jgi:hypothetical protein
VPLTNGSEPDADPDPVIFVIDLQDANKKLIKKSVSAYLKVHLHHFSRKKSPVEVKTVGIKVFLTIYA